jgi:hypothetical protein
MEAGSRVAHSLFRWSSPGGQYKICVLDITHPSAPRGLGTLSLSELGDAEDEPTSVAVVGGDGRYAAIAIENERDEDATPPTVRRATCWTRSSGRDAPLRGGRRSPLTASDPCGVL